MDRGETRRGQPCWYRLSDVGVANAINDGLFLEQALYDLIESNEYTRSVGPQAVRFFRDAAMRTVLGQHLDTCPPPVSEYSRDQWLAVVRFKTAFYTFILPCELGLLLSGREFLPGDLEAFRSACLLIGEFFQAQDDILDCYGDPAVTGKVGRDIEEGKCTWLFYTAAEAGSRDELIKLFANPMDNVKGIKAIYNDSNIILKFEKYTENIQNEIDLMKSQIQSSELTLIIEILLNGIQKRSK